MIQTRAFTAVLTKPKGQSAALAAQLAAVGIEAFDFPLIDIVPLADPVLLDAAFERLDTYALVVFVSPNAIDRAQARFNAIWPHSLPVGVVGPGSVAALARHGIAPPSHRVIVPGTSDEASGGAPRYDSESLYAQIERAFVSVVPHASSEDGTGVATDDHCRYGDGHECSSDSAKAAAACAAAPFPADPALDFFHSSDSPVVPATNGPLAGKRVLIVRGDGGCDWLSNRLREAGAEVELVAAYRRIVPEPSIGTWERVHALLAGEPHAWLVTSSEGVRNLRELADEHLTGTERDALKHAPLIAPHPRIADTAQAMGFDTITQSGVGDQRIVHAFRTLANSATHAAQAASVPSRMTDTNNSSKAFSLDEAAASSRPATPSNAPCTPFETQQPRRSLGGTAGVLLLWCVVLACAAGTGGFALNRKIERLDQLTAQRQKTFDTSTEEIRNKSEQALANIRQVDGQLSQLAGKLSDVQAQQQALQQQYQDFSRNRAAWLLDQVEQTLSTASQQLQMTGNVPLALDTLQNVDQQLATAQVAQAIAVRKAIAQDIDKLKGAPSVDLTGLAIKLDDAIDRIDALPLSGEAPIKQARPRVAPQGDSPSGVAAIGQPRWKVWWHEVSAGIGTQLVNLVQVRRIDNTDAMLTSPEQGYFVRENIKLRLLTARLSLLARNDLAMKLDLHAAQATLAHYCDTSSKDTRTVEDLLKQVDAAAPSVALPNLSSSLNAIQQLKSRG
ncbi:MAG: fused uroporphyrinogen-III synthase HemD/membrane protein HemX [Burkholderia sp.]|nr:MAG: hypothetical protein E5299_01772 [Burkholderia gladioli]